MRLLLLNETLPPEFIGGSGRVVSEAAAELARRGHDITILTTSVRTSWPANDPPGVAVRVLPRLPERWAHYRSVFLAARAQAVLRVIGEVQPDVIHAHAIAWQLGYRWIPSAASRIPCFYTAHGMMHVSYGKVIGTERWLLLNDLARARWTYNPLRNIFIKRWLHGLRRIVTVSDALRAYLASVHGYRTMQTIHNGIDLTFWRRAHTADEARRLLGLPGNVPLFLLAGRLGHDKGLDLLLTLWPRLRGSPHLALVGRVPPLPRLSVPLHVFPEQSPERMRLFYEAADVTLVPSLCFDCLPTTSLESMACGTPAMLGNRGGGPEEVVDGVTGWVIDPIDEEGVLGCLQWCIDHREELPGVGERARTFVAEHFSLTLHVDRLLEVYNGALLS